MKQPPHPKPAWGTFGFLISLLPLLILILAACGDRSQPQKTPAPPISQAPNAFLGNEACKGCHPKEFDEHAKTRHAHTLRKMRRRDLGEQAPPTEIIPGTNYQMANLGERFGFGFADGQPSPLDLAFGSGKSGMAFTAILSNTQMAEARISYFPPGKKWYLTPGQRNGSDKQLGNLVQDKSARDCLGCHTVTLPPNKLTPEEKYMGVGCESCHGPGGNHAAAMQRGEKQNIEMERLATFGGKAMSDLCGKCHRTEKAVLEKKLNKSQTRLFQAYGLAQSKCFQQGGDKLTCITCHAPHANVSTEEKGYDAACLQCHNDAKPAVQTAASAKACPINAKDKCIACHMPKRAEPVFPGSPRRVADHYIRIHRPGEEHIPAPSHDAMGGTRL